MPELLLIKAIASACAFVLTFLLFLPYIRGIRRGTVVPHVFSWLIWSFVTLVVFVAQLVDGGGLGAWPIGFSGSIAAYIAYLSFHTRRDVTVDGMDWLVLVLALLAMPAWVVASDPLWAVILLTVADLLGFLPTFRKAYRQPHEEHAGFFALAGLRNGLVIVALENYSWTTLAFPVATGVFALLVAGFVLLRRRTVPPRSAAASPVPEVPL